MRLWCSALAILLLTGCQSISTLVNRYDYTKIVVEPLRPQFEQEVGLSQLNWQLANSELIPSERADLLLQRVELYDSLGLRVLAYNDLTQLLLIRPDTPKAYDYLGVYFTLAGNFDAAYEAFDSVIELDPTYQFAHFNLGAALYYASRYSLAQDDLQAFYLNNINDPLVSIWLYLVERELDAVQAKAALQQRYNVADEIEWEWNIVAFYLGHISEYELQTRAGQHVDDAILLAERLSETYFYLGKYYQSLGDKNSATALFKLTVANNVNYLIEHRFALLELASQG